MPAIATSRSDNDLFTVISLVHDHRGAGGGSTARSGFQRPILGADPDAARCADRPSLHFLAGFSVAGSTVISSARISTAETSRS
jgi:hypothetical protein